MPAVRDFTITARLAFVTATVMFALIVVGSIVRTTGSGLACPDWPLCHGRLVPPFQVQVLLEWTHRLVAALVSVAVLGLAAWTFARRELRAHFGLHVGLALVLLASQVVLGALTVWRLLAPSVVTLHLANALLLFATLLGIAERSAPRGTAAGARANAPLLLVAAGATLLQTLLGGLVSTSHAGLACPDFPRCDGAWLPPFVGLVGLQVAHRLGAYALAGLMVLVAARAGGHADSRIRAVARLAPALVVLQIVLGAFNVLLAVPVWITAAHLATATLLFALLWLSALRARAGETA
jgi:heme a synthase